MMEMITIKWFQPIFSCFRLKYKLWLVFIDILMIDGNIGNFKIGCALLQLAEKSLLAATGGEILTQLDSFLEKFDNIDQFIRLI